MANNSSTFTLGIKTKVDSAELNRLKQQLREIQLMASDVDFTTGMNPTQIQHMTTAARQLDAALTAAFDVELNTLNIQKFNDYLKRTGTDLQQIQKGLYNAGAVGQASFAKATAELFKFNTAAKQTNVFIDKIADSMANAVRWGVASSIFNNIVGSVQKAYYYIEDLDTSINDIQIVTEKSADEMTRFAEQANNAAKSLATTTTDYTEGALIYYQQGLDDETVKTLTDITAKTSNVTGQGMQSVSEQLTAVWNGYQVANEAAAEGMQVYEEYVDKMAAVGAATASDLEELATAMSKVASAANAMGVDFDQLSAQIATIVSVTRQAPESVGTALKTIYARIGDLKMDGIDEFGVTLGEVSGQLEQVGIQIMDQSGNMRDVGMVMEEVAAKWGTWNEAQQQSIAIAIAGKRQYNNLLALFENWDMYTDTLETAANAAGTLDKQQSIALESLENKLEKLTATAEDLYDSLFDEESLKDLVDGITPLVQGFADMADAIGGLNNLLPMLGSIGMQVFSKHLANGLATFRHNLLLSTSETYKQNQAIQELSEKYKTLNFTDSSGKVDAAQKAVLQDMVNFAEEMLTKRKYMTEEEEEYYNKILDEKAVLAEQVALLKVAKEHRDNETGFGLSKAFGDNLDVKKVEKYNSALVFLEKQLNDLRSGKKGVIGLENVEKAKTDLYGFVQVLKNMGASQESIDIVEKKIKSLGRTVNGTKKISDQSLNKIIAYFKDFSFAAIDVAKLEEEVEELGLSIQKTENNFKNTLNFKDFINTASNAIGAIGQLASSINTLSNLKDIFNNEDLTEGEKFIQIIMNVSYALPALITSIINLNKAIGLTTFLIPVLSEVCFAFSAVAGGAATATEGLTYALETLKGAALKSPLASIIIALGLFIGVVSAAVAISDKLTVSLEKQEEVRNKAVKNYQDITEELKKLQTELDSTKTRLEELYAISKEDLSVTDKQEIALLESKTAQLQAQLKAEQELAKIAQKDQAKEAAEYYNKGGYKTNSSTPEYTVTTDPYSNTASQFELSEEINYNMTPEEWERFLTNNNIIDGKLSVSGKEYDTSSIFGYIGSLIAGGVSTNKEIDVQAGRDAYLQQLADNYTKYIVEEDLESWKANNINGIYDEQIAQAEKDLFNYYTAFGTMGENSERAILNNFTSQAQLDRVLKESLNEESKTFSEKSFISAFGEGGEEALEDLKIRADALGISMYDLVKSAKDYDVQIQKAAATEKKSFTQSISDAHTLKEGLDLLNEVYQDVKDKEDFDYSNLLNNKDFIDKFGGLESYEDFIEIISKSPDDLAACQEAFNQLTTEYIKNSGALNGLNEESRDSIVTLLEQEGIVNASEVVDYYLNVTKAIDELNEVKKELGIETERLEDLTKSEIEKIIEEGNVSEYAKNKLFELYLTQISLNDDPLSVQTSLTRLQQLAGAAGVTSESLVKLIEIMGKIDGLQKEVGTLDPLGVTDKNGNFTINPLDRINNMNSYKSKLDEIEQLKKEAENLQNETLSDFQAALEVEVKEYSGNAKDSKKDKRELKEYMDEFDRYWTINKAIEKVTESLSDLDKVQSHLFGKELIANLQQQNALLDEQANKYETLFSMQQQEAAELQTALRGFGVAFDAAGGVSNYAAVTQAMLNAYNTEAISEEGYEQFKKLLERYEELFYGEMVDVQNQLDDIYYEQLANNLEAWEVEIELNLELNEAEREWSDFLKEINDDFKATYRDIGKDFANIFENMNSYSKDGGTIAIDAEALRKAEAELAKLQAGGSSDMFASVSEAEKKVKELKETLMEDVESVHGLWVDAWDAYMEGIDQAASKFDDLMGKFENIDEELEYQGELIELLYGSQAYDLMDSLYDAQISNSLAQVDSLKQQADMWKELYDNAEEGSEEQAKYYEEWQEAQNNLNNSVIEHINLLKKDYSNALDKIIDNLEKELTGGLGLSEMRENWEEATAAADKYYDATERIYELETLESKFENAINGTSSLENQQKLKKLMDDQLADLEAKEKLTEYDITLAEKRLAIAQAEMALEDAQNAKNSMKLVRGVNGNWEYQYIADEEDIAAKQQEMLDAYHNLYEYVKEVQQESVESILNMTEQFFTKMNEIRNDDSLSEEEKMIKMEELRNKYYGEEGKITVLQQEFADRTDDMNMANAEFLWGLYQADEDNYRDMTEAQQGLLDGFIENGISDYTSLHGHVSGTYISMQDDLETALNDNMIPTWSSAAQTMADAWNADDGASIKAQVSKALDAIDEKTKEYESKLDELSEKSGKSFGEEGLAKDINKAVEATEKLNEVTEELCNDTITLLEDYRDAVKNIEQAWLDAYDAAMKALTTGDSKDEENPPTPVPTVPTPPPVTPSAPSESEDDSSKGKYISEAAHWDSSGKYDSKHPPQPTNMTMYLVDTNPGSKYPYGVAKRPGWSRYGWVSAFDTGGYTGEWSTGDGKLAMLHQKELVLNADDTENVLEVVRLTRDMASLTSSVGSAVMDGVKMMLYDLMGMKAPGNNMVMTPQVADGDNIFNITAEFPNANDVTSIREAILSLPNMASQYLSQNKK